MINIDNVPSLKWGLVLKNLVKTGIENALFYNHADAFP